MRQGPQRGTWLTAIYKLDLKSLKKVTYCLQLNLSLHPLLLTQVNGEVSADILAHSIGRDKVSNITTGRVEVIADGSDSWISRK